MEKDLGGNVATVVASVIASEGADPSNKRSFVVRRQEFARLARRSLRP